MSRTGVHNQAHRFKIFKVVVFFFLMSDGKNVLGDFQWHVLLDQVTCLQRAMLDSRLGIVDVRLHAFLRSRVCAAGDLKVLFVKLLYCSKQTRWLAPLTPVCALSCPLPDLLVFTLHGPSFDFRRVPETLCIDRLALWSEDVICWPSVLVAQVCLSALIAVVWFKMAFSAPRHKYYSAQCISICSSAPRQAPH